MRDLIRNYKMILKRCDSSDSGSESHPLLSSASSVISFGTAQDQCMFPDSDTTDVEADRNQIRTVKTSNNVSPRHPSMQRPFCFPGRYEAPCLDIFAHEEKIYERFSYFSKIKGVLNISASSLKDLDYESRQDGDQPKTQSSLVTIFAIWNTIMGSSLLAMPWGLYKAGLFPGILLNILIAGVCLYTCYSLLKINQDYGPIGQNSEVCDLCRMLLGKWAEITAKIFSLVVLIGANIVYWVLMSNFFYHSVHFLYGYFLSLDGAPVSNVTVICPKEKESLYNVSHIDAKIMETIQPDNVLNFNRIWDLYSTVPCILALLMFPVLNFKSVTFFTKFNSLGTCSVFYLLIFVAVKSLSWGVNTDDWQMELQLKSTFCALSGMLSLSYFIHNIIISLMRNNRYQENNGRDLSIAFGLVTFTYMFIGVMFYVCFPLAKSCIEDNILNNFERYDTMTIIARLLLLFQLFTVFPLISYMLRMNIFNNFSMISKEWSEFSYLKVICINLLTVTVCCLFACFLPRIGTLIRYTGAISGLVYIFLLPSLLKMASLRRERRLTTLKAVFYILIIMFGFLNLISQFFIEDS